MAKTKISDIIVPEIFNPYMIERTAELSALFQSGIISTNPELNALAQKGGTLINMPFFTDLEGDDEVLSDSEALTPSKIGTNKDVARLIMRGKTWGVNDLAKSLSGDDPMRAIASLVASFWDRKWQQILLATLKGVFASGTMNDNLLDISAEGTATTRSVGAGTLLDALQKMGDAKAKITAYGMHSLTENKLAKDDLIEYMRDSQGRPTIPTYLGKRVIVDDGLPVEVVNGNNVFTTYLYGEGAIGYGEGSPEVPLEMDRDSLASDNYLITRRHFILHPRGVKFTENTVEKDAPNNKELAIGANWSRVYEPKNVRIVKFKHRID